MPEYIIYIYTYIPPTTPTRTLLRYGMTLGYSCSLLPASSMKKFTPYMAMANSNTNNNNNNNNNNNKGIS